MFIKLTTRLIVNVHDLNNEASVGTFTDIRRIKLVSSNGEVKEVVAVSGNMLKHYHFLYTKRILESLGYDKFCDHCKREEAFRLDEKDARVIPGKGELKDYVESEKRIISQCAIEDIHGYLSPTRLPIKRDSRVRFSWLVPVEDQEEALSTALHNRVIKVIPLKPTAEESEKKAEAEEKEVEEKPEERVKGMMIFYKQYASGIYSFSTSLDAKRIGMSDYTLKPIEGLGHDETSIRKLASVKSFVPLISGEAGASMSRALPIVQPLEILIMASEYPGLPNLVSAYYSRYKDANLKLINATRNLTDKTIHLLVAPKEAFPEFKEIKDVEFKGLGSPAEAIVELAKLLEPSI